MVETVYADILFIINTYINFLLLRLCEFICRRQGKIYRLIISAALGGLYSFIILIPDFPFWAIVITRFLTAAVLIFAAFSFEKTKAFVRALLTFVALSFAFAGLMQVLWSYISPAAMYFNNSIAYFNIDALTLCIITAICYFALKLISKIITFKAPKNTIYDMYFEIFEIHFSCKAFLDTGNFLKEPFTNLPVIIVDGSITANQNGITLLNAAKENENFKRYIPCSSITEEGGLFGYQVKKVHIKGFETDFIVNKAYLAVTTNKIKGGEFDALMGNSIFENKTNEIEKDYSQPSSKV